MKTRKTEWEKREKRYALLAHEDEREREKEKKKVKEVKVIDSLRELERKNNDR